MNIKIKEIITHSYTDISYMGTYMNKAKITYSLKVFVDECELWIDVKELSAALIRDTTLQAYTTYKEKQEQIDRLNKELES